MSPNTLLWLIPTICFLLGVVVGAGLTLLYIRRKMRNAVSEPMQLMEDMFDEEMIEEG